MMMYKVQIQWALPCLMALLTVGSALAQVRAVREPKIGAESETGPGEVVYFEKIISGGVIEEERLILLSDLTTDRRWNLVEGESLLLLRVMRNSPLAMAGVEPGYVTGCVKSAHKLSIFGQSMKRFLCFQDLDNDGALDSVVSRKVDRPKITLAKYKRDLIYHPDPNQTPKTFRAELLYQGAAGGILRFIYREFSQDLARPAFTQEVAYDLNPEGDTLVLFKGAKILVHEAGNLKIRYTVQEPFKSR